jgi:hypothetical protein
MHGLTGCCTRTEIHKILNRGRESIKNGQDIFKVNDTMITELNFLKDVHTGEINKSIIDDAIRFIYIRSIKYA